MSPEQVVVGVVYGQQVPEESVPSASPPEPAVDPAPADDTALLAVDADAGGFTVRLHNFTGPFDLLLQLIG